MFGDHLILMLTLVLLALAIGVFLGLKRAQHQQATDKALASKIPSQWPLQLRTVVRPNEAIIWRWLRATFPNQRVLLKLPFSRFTAPDAAAGGRDYYELLNSLYATFTITDRDGNVLGCIELGSAQAKGVSNQRVKEAVLTQLGISYEVLQGTRLPTPAALRATILSVRQDTPTESTFEELDDARTQLQELLGRQRVRRPDGNGDFRHSDLGRLTDSVPPSSWQSL